MIKPYKAFLRLNKMGDEDQKWAQKVEQERDALNLDGEVPSSEITEVLKTFGIESRSGRGGR